ncbi:MAG: ketoacyl-ACP synthase III [Deltaproteobacteria bacterium]|jgi:3-oxoacyl-[acyl-carrier-protein] synthase-3|nr:ketoacyl-ACP synthase III [Deltaproteobacteria bacterium]
MKAVLEGIEFALPKRLLTNADLRREHPDWDMEKIAERTGVLERHFCAPDETALDLGEQASRQLLERLKLSASDVGAVIMCTNSPDYILPSNACLLQARLGLPTSIPAFDFSLSCSGYVYGLFIAKSLIGNGAVPNVLLVTGDSYSRFMHPGDRSTITLFGDGCAATLICSAAEGPSGIAEFALGTDGRSSESFMIEAGGARVPHSEETAKPITDATGSVRSADHIEMDGAAVLAFVRKCVPPLIEELLATAGHGMEAVDLVVFHQASALSLEYLQRWLKLPPEKTFSNIHHVGNLVSASIPVALREAELEGRLRPGMKVMLVGFGVGLSWGACLVDW